ncbi:hypothetical protein BDZ91DRAFT_768836 [Kalaharituber pfeilii]|nr:hypothetical protein BDZ91DRAFT_768836 [Kalaharituber pfeilii]
MAGSSEQGNGEDRGDSLAEEEDIARGGGEEDELGGSLSVDQAEWSLAALWVNSGGYPQPLWGATWREMAQGEPVRDRERKEMRQMLAAPPQHTNRPAGPTSRRAARE